jgi:hypothetical protein
MPYSKPFISVLVLITGLFSACHSNTADSKQIKGANFDDLFVLKNITTSLFKVDTTTRKKFVEMDSNQKRQYIIPNIHYENKDLVVPDTQYLVKYIEGRFIAKQNKVGEFQPIILALYGDDYEVLLLVILDKNHKPVSQLILSGGISAGPDDETDDTLMQHDRESLLYGDTVRTYLLRLKIPKRDTIVSESIDSISYLREIMSDGKIKLLKTDSSHYIGKYREPEHWW